MKKSLLFLASMMLGVTAFAQSFTASWPKPEAPEFTAFAPESTCYLWNVGAGGFYINHQGDEPNYPAPYYGTRSSVCDTLGTEVIFTRTNPASTEENDLEASTEWGTNTYLLVSYVTKFKESRCTFFTAWNAVWTDNNTQSNRYFNVVSSGNYIKIEPDADLTSWDAGEYLGIRATDADKVVFLYDTSEGAIGTDETFYDEWAAVSPEVYEAYYTYINSDETKAMIETYAAAQKLKTQIEYAMANGIAASDLADQFAVYNNTSSTIAELEAAAAAAYDKGRWVEIKDVFENVVQGEKNDVSGVFVNPDFENGTADGWDITYTAQSVEATNIGYMGASYSNGDVTVSKFIEAWKDDGATPANSPKYLGDGSITQTIPGLPAGKYMLAVDVIANNQGRISDSSNPNGYPDDVELFAQASLDGRTYKTNLYTKNNTPEHFEFTFIHTGGSMTLGLRVVNSAEAKMPANWICMDNLQLFYYGTVEDDPDKVMLDTYIAQVLEKYPLEGLDETVATVSIKDAYKAAIEAAQNATADYAEEQTKVEAAVANLEEAIAAYAEFQAQVDEWDSIIAQYGDQFDSDEWGEFADFIDGNEVEGYPTPSPEDVLDKMVLTPAELEAYLEQANDMFHIAIGKSIKEGDDVSFLLVNPSFADGFDGWTNSAGTFGGLKDYPCVERFGGTVDCYQIVKHVPDGVYTLSCQAFERPDTNEKNTPDMTGKVFLFMNEDQTPVQNVLADAMPEDKAINGVNCWPSGDFTKVDEQGNPLESGEKEEYYSTAGTTNKDFLSVNGYVPDGMSGASYAFRAGRYTQKVYGRVEGGEMKVGLTSNGEDAHWVLWAKFTLIYEGTGADAAKEMLDNAIKDLNDYVEANGEDNMNAAGREAADAAATAAEKVAAGEDGEAMLAEIDKVKAALADAKANVAAMDEFKAASEQLTSALEDEEANPAGQEAYEDIADDVESNYEDMTTKEILALVEKMNDVTALLNTPPYEDASEENPVDFTKRIVNNDFETGDLTGWTYYKGGDTKAAENSDGTYTINADCGNYVFNTWSSSAPEEGFWIAQTIKSLPAGAYKLEALLASDAGNVISLSANGAEASFTMEGDKATAYEAAIIFELGEEESGNTEKAARRAIAKKDLEIKATSPSWFKADNFRLTYYGTDIPVAIDGISTPAAKKANGKYLENGRIVIVKNGVKYNVAGQILK